MSCKDCEKEQDQSDFFSSPPRKAFYRWKNANIEVRCCNKHLLEVFCALNEIQKLEDLTNRK